MQSLSKYRALSPKKAIALYASINGGPVHARQIIALGLKEGSIRARAAHIWKSDEDSVTAAWRARPAREFPKPDVWSSKHDIPRRLWLRSFSWLDDAMGWDFRLNRLYVSHPDNPSKRTMLEKVRLHSDDLKKELLPGSLELNRGSLNRFDKLNSYRRFWHDIVRLATNRGATLGASELAGFSNNEAVLNAVKESLAHEEAFLLRDDIDIDELSETLSARHPFLLSDKTALLEIDLLRKAFKLKRRYGRSRKA